MLGKSFIQAFHKLLATSGWKILSTELSSPRAQLLRVTPSLLFSKGLVCTPLLGELPWSFPSADRSFLCTKHSLFVRCGSQQSPKVRFCSSWVDQGRPASCATYPHRVLPSPHLWQALNELQQATEVRESAGLLNSKILRKCTRHSVRSLSLSLSLWQYGFPWQLFFYSRVKHNSESERHSPSSEDDRDEKESKAEIQNQEDYKEIFQPKNAICQYQRFLCFWVVFGFEIRTLNWFSRTDLWLSITETSPVTGEFRKLFFNILCLSTEAQIMLVNSWKVAPLLGYSDVCLKPQKPELHCKHAAFLSWLEC